MSRICKVLARRSGWLRSSNVEAGRLKAAGSVSDAAESSSSCQGLPRNVGSSGPHTTSVEKRHQSGPPSTERTASHTKSLIRGKKK